MHRARVTATKLDYPGSMAVDSELMAAAGLSPDEAESFKHKVIVLDENNKIIKSADTR